MRKLGETEGEKGGTSRSPQGKRSRTVLRTKVRKAIGVRIRHVPTKKDQKAMLMRKLKMGASFQILF
jgi:hypothetical protein